MFKVFMEQGSDILQDVFPINSVLNQNIIWEKKLIL